MIKSRSQITDNHRSAYLQSFRLARLETPRFPAPDRVDPVTSTICGSVNVISRLSSRCVCRPSRPFGCQGSLAESGAGVVKLVNATEWHSVRRKPLWVELRAGFARARSASQRVPPPAPPRLTQHPVNLKIKNRSAMLRGCSPRRRTGRRRASRFFTLWKQERVP